MNKHHHTMRNQTDDPAATMDDLIAQIIRTSPSPERVLEMFYFSQDPGALDLMRMLMALTDKQREYLRNILKDLATPKWIE
jgi:hypothetical protein